MLSIIGWEGRGRCREKAMRGVVVGEEGEAEGLLGSE